jgi:hypothetical protein
MGDNRKKNNKNYDKSYTLVPLFYDIINPLPYTYFKPQKPTTGPNLGPVQTSLRLWKLFL